MRNSTKAKLWQLMFIITTVIIILITISSLVCFVVFDKASARVLSVDRGIDDTIVYFGYEVDGEEYTKMQCYSATKTIKPDMTITIWYSKSHPDKAVTVHDFSIYYILAPIMGGSLIAYLSYKKKSHNDSVEN